MDRTLRHYHKYASTSSKKTKVKEDIMSLITYKNSVLYSMDVYREASAYVFRNLKPQCVVTGVYVTRLTMSCVDLSE